MNIDINRVQDANDRLVVRSRILRRTFNHENDEFAKFIISAFGHNKCVYGSVASILADMFVIPNLAEDLSSCVSDNGRDAIREKIKTTLADIAVSILALGGWKNAQIDTTAALRALEDLAK